MEPKDYSEIDLPVAPDQWRVNRLVFSRVAQALLVLLAPSRGGGGPQRIFLRGIHEARYREVALPHPSHVLNVVTSEATPVAFAWLRVGTDINDRRLVQITLPEGLVSEVPGVQGDGVSRRVWVSTLLSASVDGHELYVVVGCEPVPVPGAEHNWVDYKLAVMSVATGAFQAIAPMLTPYV